MGGSYSSPRRRCAFPGKRELMRSPSRQCDNLGTIDQQIETFCSKVEQDREKARDTYVGPRSCSPATQAVSPG